MPRIARMIILDEPAVYHVMSRSALPGNVLGDVEKDYLVKLIQQLSRVYFVEVLGYAVMGNHFHLCVRMLPGINFNDKEISQRFKYYYAEMLGQKKREMTAGQIPSLRLKWSKLSSYLQEIKQRFSHYYNRLHDRHGYFWSDRFKSVIVEEGNTLINCLAYIDLNAVRAQLVRKPEEYRWCSLGYHIQRGNRKGFLSLDLGLAEFGQKGNKARLQLYRDYVYRKGGLDGIFAHSQTGMTNTTELSQIDRFRYRTRYFIDSGIIGSQTFVKRWYREFCHYFQSSPKRQPRQIQGLDGIYSLKRLSEGN